MPGFEIPAKLQRRLDERRDKVKRAASSRKKKSKETQTVPLKPRAKTKAAKQHQKHQKRNLLPAFNAAEEQWVVVDFSSDDKENACAKSEAFDKCVARQQKAQRNRQALLNGRIARARQMAEPKRRPRTADATTNTNAATNADVATNTNAFTNASTDTAERGILSGRLGRTVSFQREEIRSKLCVAAMRKESLLSVKVDRARHLARLRTPRRRSHSSTVRTKRERLNATSLALKQSEADERREAQLASKVMRAHELGDRRVNQKLFARRRFRRDELNARLQAAEERRQIVLHGRIARAAELGSGSSSHFRGKKSESESQLMMSDMLQYKLESAERRRNMALAIRVNRAIELGEGNVLLWMNRKRQFEADVLNARLEAAAERRHFFLECRKRMARSMGDNNLHFAMAFEERAMRKALTNLWHLKLEAAGARRNIALIQRKRKAYEMGDEIVKANEEVRTTHLALQLAAKMQAAEKRRADMLSQRVRRARQLGDQEVSVRRRVLKHQKAQRLLRRLEAAEAKRKRHLSCKSKRAEELGTERVEKSHQSVRMSAAIQDAARVGRIKSAEVRRSLQLATVQTRAARNNARAAAIPTIQEQRHQQEKEMTSRYIAFKMARAEMNRDVMKLLRCGLRCDPTFTLVKPIAFIV
mmetsp:Transcript_39133/g.83804  ORF Transcript_39133/g.83804 Transcript_39133/m.83804 type:complete len:646 (+) Transcript_39133:247-2184(+)